MLQEKEKLHWLATWGAYKKAPFSVNDKEFSIYPAFPRAYFISGI